MPRKSLPLTPGVPGVDLTFRPTSYFWPLAFETHLLATIKGAERKVAVRRMLADGRVSELPGFLLRSGLSAAERRMLGQVHPAFMGGEYLPDLRREEVEIARITIASVTRDVTSVYARRGKERIYYRVVDDYEGETLAAKRTRTSRWPLSLLELESFFNAAWSVFDVLDMNFGISGYDLDRMLSFIVGVESQFYPQIGTLYARRVAAWADMRRAVIRTGRSPGADFLTEVAANDLSVPR